MFKVKCSNIGVKKKKKLMEVNFVVNKMVLEHYSLLE